MPADLPGFYFDAEKNRYFPHSALPKPADRRKIIDIQPSIPDRPPVSRTATLGYAPRARSSHATLCARVAATSLTDHERIQWPIRGGSMNVFCTTPTRQFLGDTRGWLYSRTLDAADPWAPELCLHPESEVSSIRVSGSRCIATCFGPSTKICVQDLNVPGKSWLLNLSSVRDVRDSRLDGSALVLAASRKAVYINDIDASPAVQTLDTRSDVFAIDQHESLVYTGTRSGTVARFDVRVGGSKSQAHTLLSAASSVVALQTTCAAQQLLVSRMDGTLCSYDLRFARAESPVVAYAGHVNHISQRLGIAVDPAEQLLFAAGEDGRVRGWSLHTGAPLAPPGGGCMISGGGANPFALVFRDPLVTMQATDDGEGMHLWGGAAGELYKFHLGQRMYD
ncbi:WD40-repeat-containing domain protein [Mycena rebaudengoi]|nr:WD40-repeat-containing domain protein [Mycena rebaudengoi]